MSRKQVVMDFSEDAYTRLEALKDKTNATSKGEVIRNALRLLEWFVEKQEKDQHIYAYEASGVLERMKLTF